MTIDDKLLIADVVAVINVLVSGELTDEEHGAHMGEIRLKLDEVDVTRLADIIDNRSPEREVTPLECALLDRLCAAKVLTGEMELSEAETALAVKIVAESIPAHAIARISLLARLLVGKAA